MRYHRILALLWMLTSTAACAGELLFSHATLHNHKVPAFIQLPSGQNLNLTDIKSNLYAIDFRDGDTAAIDTSTLQVRFFRQLTPFETLVNHPRYNTFDLTHDLAARLPDREWFNRDVKLDDIDAIGTLVFVGRFVNKALIPAADTPSAVIDFDNDLISDDDDNCPTIPNADQTDTDADREGDACDNDDDDDRIPDQLDNCPLFASSDQTNTDGDNEGDICDLNDDNDAVIDTLDCAPLDEHAWQNRNGYLDADADGLGAGAAQTLCVGETLPATHATQSGDNCPAIANLSQLNTDGDALGDACDDDIDNDGVDNTLDDNRTSPNICSDLDVDQCDDCSIGVDGFGPLIDQDVNNDGTDTDGNGICDLADTDDDGDGIPDSSDNCPLAANPDQNSDACAVTSLDESLCFPVRSNDAVAIICL